MVDDMLAGRSSVSVEEPATPANRAGVYMREPWAATERPNCFHHQPLGHRPTREGVVSHPPQSLSAVAEVAGDRQARPTWKEAWRVEVGVFKGSHHTRGRTIQLIEHVMKPVIPSSTTMNMGPTTQST